MIRSAAVPATNGEALATRYPAPIAAAYARTEVATPGSARSDALLALGAVLVQYLAAAVVAQYAAVRRRPDAVVDRALIGLTRPGGGWGACLAAGVDWWRRRGGAAGRFVFPELLGRYVTPSADLPQTAAFLAAVRGSSPARASLQELFTWVEQMAAAGPAEAPRAIPETALQAALEEVLLALPSLASRVLLAVEHLARPGSAAQIEYATLMGPAAAIGTAQAGRSRRPLVPEHLYLSALDGRAPEIDLHPLLVRAPCATGAPAVFGLAVAARGQLEYRSPACAEPYQPAGLPASWRRFVAAATGRRRRLLLRATAGLVPILALAAGLALRGPDAVYPKDAWGAAWSPDGRYLTFNSARSGKVQVYVMRADGTGIVRLTHDDADDYDAAWSPDGTRLAFASDRDNKPALYVMNADGGGQTALTTRAGWEPAWAPDGTRIAFRGYFAGAYMLALINPDGSGEQPFTDLQDEDGQPTWSHDGSRLAFRAYATYYDIFTMKPDGTDLRQLTHTGVRHGQSDSEPAWSPDGRHIAFRGDRGLAHPDVYLMNPDGTGVTQLTNNPATDDQPAWAPDGRHIVFTSDRDGPPELYIMNADGTDQHPLTTPGTSARTPTP